MLQQNAGAGLDAVYVSGMVYPPSAMAQMLASLFSYIFFGGLILLIAGEQIFGAMQWPLGQRLVATMKQNSGVTLAIIFAANYASGMMIQTGAFEVFFNDKLVFSKLATGELPNAQYLLSIARDPSALSGSADGLLSGLPANSY